MKVAAQRTAQGDHFKSHAINPKVQEGAVIVGAVSFMILGSAGVIITAASVIENGAPALTSSRHVLATVGTDVDGDAPFTEDPETGAGGDTPGDKGDPSGVPGQDTPKKPEDKDSEDDDKSDESQPAKESHKAEEPVATETKPEASAEPTVTETETLQETAAAPAENRIHIISWGETLCEISQMYGVSVDAIAEANSIRDVNLIYANSALIIPAV